MPPIKRTSQLTIADCGGCGVCCMHMGYPAFLNGSETQADEEYSTSLPIDLKTELLHFIAAYQPPPVGDLDGPCVWFDMQSRGCKHHAHRPRVCRDFAIGSQGCLDWRQAYRDKIVTVA